MEGKKKKKKKKKKKRKKKKKKRWNESWMNIVHTKPATIRPPIVPCDAMDVAAMRAMLSGYDTAVSGRACKE